MLLAEALKGGGKSTTRIINSISYQYGPPPTLDHVIDLGWDGVSRLKNIGQRSVDFLRLRLGELGVTVPDYGQKIILKSIQDEYLKTINRKCPHCGKDTSSFLR